MVNGAEQSVDPRRVSDAETERLLSAVGLGLFFVWLGVAFMLDVGYAIGLLGIGAIALGEQVTRRLFGLALEWFWVVVGALFALGGMWELLEIEMDLLPVLLIALGLVVLTAAFKGRHLAHRG